jgi:hypothetical protein
MDKFTFSFCWRNYSHHISVRLNASILKAQYNLLLSAKTKNKQKNSKFGKRQWFAAKCATRVGRLDDF